MFNPCCIVCGAQKLLQIVSDDGTTTKTGGYFELKLIGHDEAVTACWCPDCGIVYHVDKHVKISTL